MTTPVTPKQPIPGWKVVLFLLVVAAGVYAQHAYNVLGAVESKYSEWTKPVVPLAVPTAPKIVEPSTAVIAPPAGAHVTVTGKPTTKK